MSELKFIVAPNRSFGVHFAKLMNFYKNDCRFIVDYCQLRGHRDNIVFFVNMKAAGDIYDYIRSTNRFTIMEIWIDP